MENEFIEMSDDGTFEIPEVMSSVKNAPAASAPEFNKYIPPTTVETLETDGVFQGLGDGEYKVFSHSIDGKYNVDVVIALSFREETSKVYLNKDYDLTVATDTRKLVIDLKNSIDEPTRSNLRESIAEKYQNYIIIRLSFNGKR